MEPKLLTAERFVNMRTGISYRYVYSDTEYFRPHFHDYYEIFLLLDGEATHLVNGERIPLGKGALVLIRPTDVHDYTVREGKSCYMLNITFTAETAEGLISYLGDGFFAERLLSAKLPPEVTLHTADISYILTHMTTVRTIGEDEPARLQTALRILIFRILTRFFADYSEESSPDMPPWLSLLCGEMRKNANFTYGISRMMELSGKSREHLSRSMKKYIGVTPSEFVNDLRLRFIANMLKNSNHNIADIVFESGFGNLSWASTQFKRRYGVTMSEYRKTR